MQARVKDDYRLPPVTAAGLEWSKDEWRYVPASLVDQLKDHPYLEFRDDPEPGSDESGVVGDAEGEAKTEEGEADTTPAKAAAPSKASKPATKTASKSAKKAA